MKAYFKMPEETSKNITTDGWLLTGDLATIDDKGFVSITGRKKDLIITAGGKNIAPSAIENLLTLSKYISQACIIGDKRRYLTALITLDLESVKSYMNAQGLEYSGVVDEANIELIRKLIDEEINLANQSLASFESIKKYDIVPEFTIENELLTPTLKVKRNLVMEHYAEKIEAMYIE